MAKTTSSKIDWQGMLKRCLMLADLGYGMDNIHINENGKHVRFNGEVLEAEPFTVAWIREWYNHEPKGYVVRELALLETKK